jgi:hypothetical protein
LPVANEIDFAVRIFDLHEKHEAIRNGATATLRLSSHELSELQNCQNSIAAEYLDHMDQWGWPGIIGVGFEAALTAAQTVRWCFTQPQFMRRALPLVEQGYRFGNAYGEWFAWLYDAIMYYENRPQVYGTYVEWGRDRELAPARLVEPEKVNARRAAMMLEPIEKQIERYQREAHVRQEAAPIELDEYNSKLNSVLLSFGWQRRPTFELG